jgi:hypothetical protein
MQYNSQCATRRRCPSCTRPALLRACSLSFLTRAASRLAAFLAATREGYLECRRPQTFTPHQPECSTTSILIFQVAGLPRRRRGFADAFTSCKATRCSRGQRANADSSGYPAAWAWPLLRPRRPSARTSSSAHPWGAVVEHAAEHRAPTNGADGTASASTPTVRWRHGSRCTSGADLSRRKPRNAA